MAIGEFNGNGVERMAGKANTDGVNPVASGNSSSPSPILELLKRLAARAPQPNLQPEQTPVVRPAFLKTPFDKTHNL